MIDVGYVQRRTCAACGDPIRWSPRDTLEVLDQMRAHCRTCARELLGLAVPQVGSLQHGTGGGVRVIKETKTH